MDITFPLTHRTLIRGCKAHQDAGLGCACDYQANNEPLYSPVDGVTFLFEEAAGGWWIRVTDSTGRKWEHAHLSKRIVKTGDHVKRMQQIGVTGGKPGDPGAGQTTTGPHLHLQVLTPSGTRVDPEPLLANAPLAMSNPYEKYENKIIRSVNGGFALVIRGKKFVIEKYLKNKNGEYVIFNGEKVLDLNSAALLTWMQRNKYEGFVNNIPQDTFDAIPLSNQLDF